jgi:D-aspartate ligase
MSLESDPDSRAPALARPPALILGDDPVNGLGVARNLGRTGVPVHRVGAQIEPLLRSRYIRTQRVVPGLDTMDDAHYLREVEEAGARIGGQPVLFPLTDLHVMRLCRLEGYLRNRFRLTTPSLASAMTLVNKRQFYEAAAALGVDHPATRFPETLEEFECAAESLGYPVYLKPEISPLYHGRFGRKGFVARDREALLAGAAELLSSGLRAILQEIIPGDASQMHGCAGYRRGADAVWVCYRRRREFPEGFGSGTRLVTIPSFVQRTKLLELLAAVGHHGLFDAEFKLDPRDGTLRLLDINARSWWQNALPTRSGINMIALAYQDASSPERVAPLPAQEYTVGIEWLHGYNDYMAARDSGMGLGTWLRSLPSHGELAFFAVDDPLPGTLQLSGIAWRMFLGFTGVKVKDERGYRIEPLPAGAAPAPEPPHASKDAGPETALR